ncbi:efflux transporter outer membrane subunit [Novosphingobium mangrovi (ex Huang et al. 2023)]|uniref:TolC family protein n=1 Tax=Novosphingobium mangrovi (ex Huang et al. 2023) TaxID=2976432 RepID=A0ABT2I226_9SPHN|nr:TolC family protein [Novosphingobium mangrovi (ex Huang et al. 2023)]MCT2398698.1 TolC family protein [Novosphingobium mangrovi (ex Huang et al. 2023)]
MRSAFLSLLPAVLLAGCVAGPDYHMPKDAVAASDAPGRPFVSVQGTAFSAAPLPDEWWQLYNDPRLNELVEQALAANTDLRAADANLRRAAAIARQVEAGRTVSTAVGGGIDLSRPSSTGYSLPGILGYDAGISAGLPLDLSGRIARAIEASRADEDVSRAARDYTRVAVAAAVTRAYAGVCAANFSLATNRRVVALQRSTLEATQRLQRGGRGTVFDVTRAQAAVDRSEALLPAIVAQRQAHLFLIATLLGKVPADYPTDLADCSALPALTSPLPTGDGAALIRRRPDVRAAERQMAADTARVGVAMADLYPQVSIGGSTGIGGPFKSFGSGNSFGFSLGTLLSWSFPNRPVVKARIAAAGAQADADLANFDSTVLGALRETETALNTYAQSRESIAALQKARDSAAGAAGQADELFRFGRSDFLQVLDAERSLADAEVALADARTMMVDDQIDIFLALGGGWQR